PGRRLRSQRLGPIDIRVMRLRFFFQAEDGIRDLYVTGVQTCALPISASETESARLAEQRQHAEELAAGEAAKRRDLERAGLAERSEERRVGKECRSRWSP